MISPKQTGILIRKEKVMQLTTRFIKFHTLLILCLIFTLLFAGCNVLQNVGQPSGGDDVFDEIDLSGDGDVADYPDDGEDTSADEVPPPAAIVCPKGPEEFVLFVSHTWDFSPNRDVEKMKINGKTESSSPCPLTVAGSTVLMEECRVPITNTGFMQTDGGSCDISASGAALISIENAFCENGQVTMTIFETIDSDSGSGSMNCPNKSQPYFPFFPYSGTTRTFTIQVGGSIKTEDMDPDLSNQFKYNKEWTLHGPGLDSPTGEE
jgi:hypothetical protein